MEVVQVYYFPNIFYNFFSHMVDLNDRLILYTSNLCTGSQTLCLQHLPIILTAQILISYANSFFFFLFYDRPYGHGCDTIKWHLLSRCDPSAVIHQTKACARASHS